MQQLIRIVVAALTTSIAVIGFSVSARINSINDAQAMVHSNGDHDAENKEATATRTGGTSALRRGNGREVFARAGDIGWFDRSYKAMNMQKIRSDVKDVLTDPDSSSNAGDRDEPVRVLEGKDPLMVDQQRRRTSLFSFKVAGFRGALNVHSDF